jgi:hypothetical protein
MAQIILTLAVAVVQAAAHKELNQMQLGKELQDKETLAVFIPRLEVELRVLVVVLELLVCQAIHQ